MSIPGARFAWWWLRVLMPALESGLVRILLFRILPARCGLACARLRVRRVLLSGLRAAWRMAAAWREIWAGSGVPLILHRGFHNPWAGRLRVRLHPHLHSYQPSEP